MLALIESSSSVDNEHVQDQAGCSAQGTGEEAYFPDVVASSDGDSDYGINDGVVSSSSESEAEDISEDPIDNTEGTEANIEIGQQIAGWATKHSCTRVALNELLEILRHHGNRLPKDVRTLLQTPKIVVTADKCGGKYIYFGLESGILRNLAQKMYHSDDNTIHVSTNIDGVPLFKSSNIQFWPILCSFDRFEPFIVALYCGSSKPEPVQDYLADFLQELQHLVHNGLNYDDITYHISIRAFICDAPARAFLKCVKGHSGYDSCESCKVHGSWNGRVVFNSQEIFPNRTNQEFHDMSYKGHHQHCRSPLIDAGVSCVEQFSLDYMHLVCLGVVKRLLSFLKQGPKDCRLSHQQKTRISERLEALNGLMPSEFARQPRPLSELERWKATEFRQFLLYSGPVVLRGVVSDDLYNHFLTLTVGMSIMLDSIDEKRNHYLPYAKELLQYFVNKSTAIYGNTFNVYNVHNLLHLSEDVQFFQCSLNDVSGFKYENHLQIIKKLVKNSQNPIAQVTKRLTEIEKSSSKYVAKGSIAYINKRRKDRCFLLQNEDFAFVCEKRRDGKLVCDCISQCQMENFFTNPCDSKLLNVTYITYILLRDRSRRKLLTRKDLRRKVVCLPYRAGVVLFPLLHEVERH